MNGTAQGEGRKATLLGMVMPTRRLPGESDFSLCLSVGDGQEYRVEKNVASNMLKEFVYERVMVQGIIIPGEKEPSLVVEKFEPWQLDEDDIYDND